MVKTLKEHFTPPTSATTVEQEPKSNMPPNAERHVALMFCYFPWRSTSKHVHRRPKTPAPCLVHSSAFALFTGEDNI